MSTTRRNGRTRACLVAVVAVGLVAVASVDTPPTDLDAPLIGTKGER